MVKVVLYIATTLDGYIARPDGDLDWLISTPFPQEGDYGYADLLTSIENIIMGRLTYSQLIGFGGGWPYAGFSTYVVTTNKELKIQSPDTYLLTSQIKDFVSELKGKTEKDIWLIGGGRLVTSFINEGLLDKMIITLIPKIIGEGIPLFPDKPKETNWKLSAVKSFDTGLVNLTYEKAD
mgnify:CR=1 FL=1